MKLGLGTVQFGMEYGNFNVNGQPDLREIQKILSQANEAGIAILTQLPPTRIAKKILA